MSKQKNNAFVKIFWVIIFFILSELLINFISDIQYKFIDNKSTLIYFLKPFCSYYNLLPAVLLAIGIYFFIFTNPIDLFLDINKSIYKIITILITIIVIFIIFITNTKFYEEKIIACDLFHLSSISYTYSDISEINMYVTPKRRDLCYELKMKDDRFIDIIVGHENLSNIYIIEKNISKKIPHMMTKEAYDAYESIKIYYILNQKLDGVDMDFYSKFKSDYE